MPHNHGSGSKSSDLTQRDSDLVTVRLDSDNEYENRKVCIQPPLPDEDGDSDTTMMDALEIEPTAKQHQANEKYGGASAHTLEMPWRDSMNKLIKEMFLMNRAVVPQLLIIAILMKTASIAYAVHQPFINNAFFETLGHSAEEAPAQSTKWQSYNFAAQQFSGVLWATFAGRVSDAIGRRPPIFLALLGELLPVIPDLTHVRHGSSLWWYWGTAIVGGAIIPQQMLDLSVRSAIADVITSPTHRTWLMGVYESALPIGLLIGAPIGRTLATQDALLFTVLVMSACCAWVWLLSETLPAEGRRGIRTKKEWIDLFLTPIVGVRILWRKGRDLLLSSIVLLLSLYVHWTAITVSSQFCIKHLGFGREEIMIKFIIGGISATFFSVVASSVLSRFLSLKAAMVFGIVISTAQSILFGLSNSTTWLYVVTAFTAAPMMGPLVTSFASTLVNSSEQGSVQGALSVVYSLMGGVGSLVSGELFKRSTGGPGSWVNFPGLPFVVAGVVQALALPLALVLRRTKL